MNHVAGEPLPRDRQEAPADESRMLGLQANLAKFFLLAALVPPATVAIARRASEIEGADAAAGWTAATIAVGSGSAIVGALLAGRAADLGTRSARSRWWVLFGGTALGVLALAWMSLSRSGWELAVGWGLAQAGLSGAIAVSRALLTHVPAIRRERSAVVMIAVSSVGLLIPIALLMLLPGSAWGTSICLALCAVAVVAIALARTPAPADVQHHPRTSAPAPESEPSAAPRMSWGAVLVLGFSSQVALSAYLTYHPLDIVTRLGLEWDQATQAGTLVLALALLGLVGASVVMLIFPRMLGRTLPLLTIAGVLLVSGLVLRAMTTSLALLAIAGLLSGIAIGISTTLLFTAALALTTSERAGWRLGVYSAVIGIGSLIGPSLVLGAVIAIRGVADYSALFLLLALIPLSWIAVALTAILRPRRTGAR
ncbi:Major Facilitator Superfamily protein [Microbacterium azadirachtae]|uniref:Major Facilitator Superfamily protein n=2 Tax=Microbacterium azadirachtae TaxID=582680 RepID=A0A0F0LM41_9MICO|nr:Major Facilitator Superfamily protein [Microbacterium azadirachtae]